MDSAAPTKTGTLSKRWAAFGFVLGGFILLVYAAAGIVNTFTGSPSFNGSDLYVVAIGAVAFATASRDLRAHGVTWRRS